MLSRPREPTCVQYQLSGSCTASKMSNVPTRMPTTTGTATAHRNGFERAHAEMNISQPTVGSAQSALSGIAAIIFAQVASGSAGPQMSAMALSPWNQTSALNSTSTASSSSAANTK